MGEANQNQMSSYKCKFVSHICQSSFSLCVLSALDSPRMDVHKWSLSLLLLVSHYTFSVFFIRNRNFQISL